VPGRVVQHAAPRLQLRLQCVPGRAALELLKKIAGWLLEAALAAGAQEKVLLEVVLLEMVLSRDCASSCPSRCVSHALLLVGFSRFLGARGR
jgi:hypothetical protein